ncbi:MAG: SusC/RagA family TonB-linked outer membrane protein [Bacteroidales bacterium]|nr:SusC/RagA family TonB-linked outer membrane protein [Bacteroidales bacterium]
MKNYKNLRLKLTITFLVIGVFTYAQTKYGITGTVRDASDGTPLAGINIDVPGIASAITEDDGTFLIDVPSKNVILQVNGADYARNDIPVRGRDTIDIVLYEKSYKGSQKDVYTPLGYVSSTQLSNSWEVVQENTDISVAVTPDILMQGYASGVNTIFRSGMPGSGANMYLHGFNTLNAGNTPLFVVDGMPFENTQYASSLISNYQANPLASIDIKDIESITILKDGNSLYGVKGANGVVLIKTIKPKVPETRINAHLHTGVNFEPLQYPVLDAIQHKNLLSDILQSNPQISPLEIQQLPYFDNNLPVKQPWGYEGNIDYYRYNHNTNWQNEIYNNASYNQNYYLNVAGGDEIAIYMLSLGFLDQKGTLKNTDFQRFNTRFNSEVKLSKSLLFHANMSFVYGTKNLANEGADSYKNPILASLIKSPFTTSHLYDAEGDISPNVEPVDIFGNSNPYVLSNNLSLVNVNYRFLGSFELSYNINKNLNIVALLGLNFNKEREKSFYPGKGVAFAPVNDIIILNEAQHRVDRLFSLYNDVYADYKKQFSMLHSISVRAGFRYQNNKTENDYGEGFNTNSDDFRSIQYGEPMLRNIGGSIGAWNWLSAYTSLNYGLMNKYYLNILASGDATSRSGMDASPMFFYPSAALAWLASNEEFLKNAGWINLLKFRVSYGLSGNDDIGNYNNIRYYRPQNLLGAYGIVRGNLVNTSLKPETVKRLNAGADLSLVNERINLGIDLYSNEVKDMILLITPSRLSGFNSYITNAGSMSNKGIDIKLNARIINGPFKWDVGLIVSKYKNNVLDLAGEEKETEILGATIQTKVGQPLGLFYGYKTNGVYDTKATAETDGLYILQGLTPVYFEAGDIRFMNQNEDKLIDIDDRVIIGDPNPDLFGSITSTFKFKQLTLNALFNYSMGNDVYNYTRSLLESGSTYNNQSTVLLNRWRQEGDITDVPRVAYGDPMGNARFSDRWIEDGSFIRLKSLVLSYNLNFKAKFIQSCTLFASGENLVTFTNYKGTDPEFALGNNPLYYGIDACVVKQPRTVSVGVKLSL